MENLKTKRFALYEGSTFIGFAYALTEWQAILTYHMGLSHARLSDAMDASIMGRYTALEEDKEQTYHFEGFSLTIDPELITFN